MKASVMLYTDNLGRWVVRQEYYPFSGSSRGQGHATRPRYTGNVFDPETWFYFFNARYYAPEIGRFLSPDPWINSWSEMALKMPHAENMFAYIVNSPSNRVDLQGLFF